MYLCVCLVGSRESLRFLDTIHPVSVNNVFFSNSSSPRNMASLSNRGNQAVEGKGEKKGEEKGGEGGSSSNSYSLIS